MSTEKGRSALDEAAEGTTENEPSLTIGADGPSSDGPLCISL